MGRWEAIDDDFPLIQLHVSGSYVLDDKHQSQYSYVGIIMFTWKATAKGD